MPWSQSEHSDLGIMPWAVGQRKLRQARAACGIATTGYMCGYRSIAIDHLHCASLPVFAQLFLIGASKQ